MAIKLQRKGIKRVRPLHGGLQKWEELKFPTDNMAELSVESEKYVSKQNSMKNNLTSIAILFFLIALLFSNNIYSQETHELLPIEEGRFWGFVNKKGEIVIKPKFISVNVFSEGLAGVQLNEIAKTYKTKNGEITEFKVAVINKKGEIVINTPYDSVGSFVNGLASVRIGDRYEKYYYPGKYGFIDKNGKLVINPQFDAVSDYFSEELALFKIGNKWGFFDKDRKVVIEANFKSAENFSEGLATAKKGSKFGFIDKTGEFVIKPNFQNARSFINGFAEVRFKKYDKWYVIDKSGKTIKEAELFDKNSNNLPREYPIPKVIDGKKVFVDETGKVVFENKWDFFRGFRNGVALVLNNDKENYPCGLHIPGWVSIFDACFHWGYINNKGEYIWKKLELK